jgi:hypothetical protein
VFDDGSKSWRSNQHNKITRNPEHERGLFVFFICLCLFLWFFLIFLSLVRCLGFSFFRSVSSCLSFYISLFLACFLSCFRLLVSFFIPPFASVFLSPLASSFVALSSFLFVATFFS